MDFMLNISQFIGIPFVDRGRSFDGADCWGLVRLVYDTIGIKLPLHPIPAFDPICIDAAVQTYKPIWQQLEKPEIPCLIAFKLSTEWPDLVTHVGIFIGNEQFLHTRSKTGAVIERLTHPYWSARHEGFYQWKK